MMKEIVVVGGGVRFQGMVNSLEYRDKKFLAIFDNDTHKHGMRLSGIPVLPVEKIADYNFDAAVITPKGCKWRLTKQLLNLHVDCQKIRFYHHENDLDEYLSVDVDGTIIADINGTRLNVRHASDEMIINEVLLEHGYQYHWGNPNEHQIVIDIGMNVGIASLYFAQQNAVEKVYGFEPFAEPYESALENFHLNSEVAKKIIPANCGLSNESNHVNVPFNQEWITASRTFFSELPKNVLEEIELRDAAVEFNRIRAIEGEDKIYIVKIDCEGSEYQVFESFEKVGALEKIDMILGETHDARESEIFEYLTRHQFHYFYRRITPTQCIFKAVHKRM